jgi:hypothetical protein
VTINPQFTRISVFGFERDIQGGADNFSRFRSGEPANFIDFFPHEFASLASPREMIATRITTKINPVQSRRAINLRSFGSLPDWRNISGYRFEAKIAQYRPATNDLADPELAKRIKKSAAVNFSAEKPGSNKRFETQEQFKAQACPTCKSISPIQDRSGFARTFNGGVTLKTFTKDQ